MDPLQSERLDALLATLADSRRRQALGMLRDRRNGTAVEELANHLADGTPEEGLSAAAVETRLQHVDLPKLAAADLVDYDSEAGTVSAADGLHEVQPLLDAIEGLDAESDEGPNFPVGPTIRTQQTMARFYLESMERQIEQLQS